ncbi:unnamed protein product [Brassica rapa subsp. narinosa]
MTLEILLPTEEVKEVELEYIKLEKHCFQCYSLFHEKDDCPSIARGDRTRNMGINQRNALMRIEAGKRRHDDRRGYSRNQEPRRSSHEVYRIREPLQHDSHVSMPSDSRHRTYYASEASRGYRGDRRSLHHTERARGLSEVTRRPREAMAEKHSTTGASGSLGRNLNTRLSGLRGGEQQVGPNWSQASHTPPLRHKEPLQLSINDGNSNDRRSALERIVGP